MLCPKPIVLFVSKSKRFKGDTDGRFKEWVSGGPLKFINYLNLLPTIIMKLKLEKKLTSGEL